MDERAKYQSAIANNAKIQQNILRYLDKVIESIPDTFTDVQQVIVKGNLQSVRMRLNNTIAFQCGLSGKNRDEL